MSVAPGIHWLGINAIELLRRLCRFKSLSVIDAILGDGILGNGIQEITVFHDRLRSLQIVKCRVLGLCQVLELDNCGLLTSVSLNLQYLQNIRLIHCRKFVDLSLQSPKLSSITVSNCASLHRINLSSNSLQKLVQRQESLTTLALRCHCLQEVDLTECESLTNSICDVFSDGGGCPTLRSLILDNCE
ncbi:hypothetical protein IFM89_029586, partial [Coptis chinensis]